MYIRQIAPEHDHHRNILLEKCLSDSEKHPYEEFFALEEIF